MTVSVSHDVHIGWYTQCCALYNITMYKACIDYYNTLVYTRHTAVDCN